MTRNELKHAHELIRSLSNRKGMNIKHVLTLVEINRPVEHKLTLNFLLRVHLITDLNHPLSLNSSRALTTTALPSPSSPSITRDIALSSPVASPLPNGTTTTTSSVTTSSSTSAATASAIHIHHRAGGILSVEIERGRFDDAK